MYLSPSTLTSSILILLGLHPLNAINNFLLVKGDGLMDPGRVGEMMVDNSQDVTFQKRKKYEIWATKKELFKLK
jgi:hypothetical protein